MFFPITLIAGLILLAIPFILIGFFDDKKRGFIYVLFFSLFFQAILGILTQVLGIFYYKVIIGCTALADITLLFILFKLKTKNKKNFSFTLKNIDWVVLIVAVISILSLFQVHYNYTGKINLATDTSVGYHQVKNMTYQYPYFSDEWYAVSLVDGAISNHSLPVRNILNSTFFPNLELFFHSFIAQVMLLLGLNPLLHYTALLIFFNALIIILIYLFLRISEIPKLTAGVCSLFALYITSGGNLPGLWQLIPFNFGIIFFLLSVCFMGFKDVKAVFLSVVLACLFYPPLILFCSAGLIVFLIFNTKTPKEHLYKIIGHSLLALFFIVPIFYILLALSPLAKTMNYIISKIFFVSFVAPFAPQFYFYNIMPIATIILAILGIYYIYKSLISRADRKSQEGKWILLAELILGCIYWFCYSFTDYRFFLEYERVAIFTSIIAVAISGFGLKQIEDNIKEKFKSDGQKLIKIIEAAILAVFALSIPFYTQGENWKKNTYIDPVSKTEVFPKSPANNYLTQDDLNIFKGIRNKRFLSLAWKGTVIGVATKNYPALVKQGTISIGSERTLNNFLKSECQDKINLAKKLKLDYIYLNEFNCPGFQEIDRSTEDLVLYKVYPVK